ncbi:MAG: B12-binding domain-containing radical SAM protein [Nanoarchaeota archaeon]|nr:B12-binding domain-containing radical SAM protein [Nanoarchaeota archaeon]
MKLMLIVPPNTLEERYGSLSGIGTLYPPLGLAYLAAYAEEKGHEVKVIDSEAEGYGYEDINKIAKKFEPDLVGMSTYCTTLNKAYRVAENLKKIIDVKVVLGGAQATLEPEKTLSNKNIDFVIYGEGEKSLGELMEVLNGDVKEFSKVKGLVYKNSKGEIKVNKKRELIKDLDEIPLPARHHFPMNLYHSSANLRGKRTLNIMTSRGCPYQCTYCAGSLIFGTNFRFVSTDKVIEEIKQMRDEYKIDSIQFYDETFTVNRKRVIELCDKMIKDKLNLTWSCFTRVNLVDKELLKKMKDAGCYLIFYGFESGVQRLLNMINKGITLEQSLKAVKMTHEVGIETWGSFILGLPSETKEETKETIEFALKLNPTFIQFPIAIPFPGTKMHEQALQHGKLKEDWDNFTAWDEVVYVTKGRSEKELKEAVKNAYKKFYLRPSYIINRMKSIYKLPIKNSFALAKAAFLTFIK